MRVEIREPAGMRVSQLPVEIVERKGKGHPDTLCDKATEELSIALSNFYLENYGRIYHHNVDKCVLVGGESRTEFGGGEVIEQIYLLLTGRAALSEELPLEDFAVENTKRWLADEMRYLDVENDIIIDHKIKKGSEELVKSFDYEEEVPRANDTSIGVAFAPLTEVERIVYEVEKTLNSAETKSKIPAIGEDIKVMGIRHRDTIWLTIASAIISSLVEDSEVYSDVTNEIKDLAYRTCNKISDMETRISVNSADIPETGSYYLTTTGTSAEHGDDGQVGRGNRVNGLITPYRPMTMESTAGKNPVNHVGKIYSVAAREIVDRVVDLGVDQACCYMVSEIGSPISDPLFIDVELSDVSMRRDVEQIIEEVLDEMPDMWQNFIERRYEIF